MHGRDAVCVTQVRGSLMAPMEARMSRYPELARKTVLVTESSKALGAETARAFARQGSKSLAMGGSADDQ
jgi:NADP-dependent 3-hydroxy acid dehydrogenase YdfG